jgi:polysaccharide export outer membrane protein
VPGEKSVDYVIGPLDVLTITVFREPDLSLDEVPVDASGSIIFPLVGQISVAGKTSTEVTSLIRDRLGERFLVDPQVSVNIKSSVSQKVTVEGQVTEPGVFELQGQTSLLQALAMAKGPTRVAKLSEVVVFREQAGKRYAAMFDVSAIRRGEAADPQILGNDTVVVGLSQSKSLLRDFLATAPLLTSVFIAVEQNN